MKILSKYKDYYDYLQGVIGIDPLAFYERNPVDPDFTHTKFSSVNYKNYMPTVIGEFGDRNVRVNSESSLSAYANRDKPVYRIDLHICDVQYSFLVDQFGSYFPRWVDSEEWSDDCFDPNWPNHILDQFVKSDDSHWKFKYRKGLHGNVSSELNQKWGIPIIMQIGKEFIGNPRLSDLRFNSVVDAESMYLMLTDWFLRRREGPPPAPQTDHAKIESHGMDPKTSFRPKIKK
jgi:hypothetical protein